MWPTLKSRRQFHLVYTQGQKSLGTLVVLFHLANLPDDATCESQVAFVASRKVGGAVQRNRAKRVMRAAFAEILKRPNIPEGWFVLVARRAILESKSHQVAEQLRTMIPVRDPMDTNEAANNAQT